MFRNEADAEEDGQSPNPEARKDVLPQSLVTHDFILRDNSKKRRFMLDYLSKNGDFAKLQKDEGENLSFYKPNDRIPLETDFDWPSGQKEKPVVYNGMNHWKAQKTTDAYKPILSRYISSKEPYLSINNQVKANQ